MKGFPKGITAIFPDTLVQTCIVHLLCYSLDFASWKERKALAAALEAFAAGPCGERYPPIVASWRRNWAQVDPCFAFSPAVRRIINTTNAIESLHSRVRKAIRNKGHFPTDEAAVKLIFLALKQAEAKWK
ncbi:MAG: transposase, partial [Phenylobacterium sp.]|nr:transposase [Phenylobacterium sp.]